jgi:hypothetical protein
MPAQPVRARPTEAGVALFAAIMVLVILAAIGLALVAVTTTDLRISGNLIRANQRFYAVDAGYTIMRKNVYDGMAQWAVPGDYGVDVDGDGTLEDAEIMGTITQSPWYAVDQTNILEDPASVVSDLAEYGESSWPIDREFTFGDVDVQVRLGHPSWDGYLMANPASPANGLDGNHVSFFLAESDQTVDPGESYHSLDASLYVQMDSNLLFFLDDAETTVDSRDYDASTPDDPVTAVTNKGIDPAENDFEGVAADTTTARVLVIAQKPSVDSDPPTMVGIPTRDNTKLTFKLNNDTIGVDIPYLDGTVPATPPGGRYFWSFAGAADVALYRDSQEIEIYVHKVTIDNPYSDLELVQPSVEIYVPSFITMDVPWDDPTTTDTVETSTTYSFVIPAVRDTNWTTSSSQQFGLQLRDRVTLVPRAQLVLLEDINTDLLTTQAILPLGEFADGFQFTDLIPYDASDPDSNADYKCHAGPPDCDAADFWSTNSYYAPDYSPFEPSSSWIQVLTPDIEQYVPEESEGSGTYPSFPKTDWDGDVATTDPDERLCIDTGDLAGYCASP